MAPSAPGADTRPGAEVDLLAHAPHNWWLGSRERERGYWVLKTGYGGKYKYLSGPHMTTMTLDIKTQCRLFTFVIVQLLFIE